MKQYSVIIVTDRGDFRASMNSEDNIPPTLILQAVMTHQQLAPLLANLGTNTAKTILINSIEPKVNIPTGLTLVFPNGVNINGPLLPSPVPNVPAQFDGVKLTQGLAALVNYAIEPNVQQTPVPNDFDEEYDTEH